MKNVRRLTEGAILLAIFVVLLLLTFYVPLLGMIVNLFLATPVILFAAKNDGKSIFVFVIASMLLSLLLGTLLSVPIALSYATTGAVIGYMIQKQKSRWSIFVSGSLVFLVNLLVIYGVSIVFFKMNMFTEMIDMMQDSFNRSADLLKNFGNREELELAMKQYEEGIELVKVLIPTIMVTLSFMTVFIIQLVSFPIIKRFGIVVEKWKSLKDLSLPKSTSYYFLLILIISMVFKPEEGTFGYIAIINLTYILNMLLILQGYMFLFFYFDQKRYSKAISITIAIISFIIPIFRYMIGILGIVDLSFGLRQKIKKE